MRGRRYSVRWIVGGEFVLSENAKVLPDDSLVARGAFFTGHARALVSRRVS